MSTSVPRFHPSLRLVTLYLGVLICAVLAAWATSVGLGFHVAPRTPSAALIRDVATAPTSLRPLAHPTLHVKSTSTTVAPKNVTTSSANAVNSSSGNQAAATKFVPVAQNVEVINPSQNDSSSTTSSADNSSTNSSDVNSSTTTTTVAGD